MLKRVCKHLMIWNRQALANPFFANDWYQNRAQFL